MTTSLAPRQRPRAGQGPQQLATPQASSRLSHIASPQQNRKQYSHVQRGNLDVESAHGLSHMASPRQNRRNIPPQGPENSAAHQQVHTNMARQDPRAVFADQAAAAVPDLMDVGQHPSAAVYRVVAQHGQQPYPYQQQMTREQYLQQQYLQQQQLAQQQYLQQQQQHMLMRQQQQQRLLQQQQQQLLQQQQMLQEQQQAQRQLNYQMKGPQAQQYQPTQPHHVQQQPKFNPQMYQDTDQCPLNPFYEYQQYPTSGDVRYHDYNANQPQVTFQQPQNAQEFPQQAKPDNSNNRLLRPRYMSHNRSRSDPNFAVHYDRSNQVKMPSVTPQPNASSSNRSHHRSPSDPALNQSKEPEAEMLLVNIESSDEPTPHWNPFSPYYESNELDFTANQNDVTDDDFASLRASNEKISQTGTNSSFQPNVESHQPNAGYHQASVGFHQTTAGYQQPSAGNRTSEFRQGATTDIFGSATFDSQVAELQQGLRSSLENLQLVDVPAGFGDNSVLSQQQQVTDIVQDGNNPFLQGYRSTEIERHLNFAGEASSEDESEEADEPEYSGFHPPPSPGVADPFGSAPFIVQKAMQVPPTTRDAFGSSPFNAPHPSQSKAVDYQLNNVQLSEQQTDTSGHASSFTSTQGSGIGMAPGPFHVEGDVSNSCPFVGNVTEHEDPSGLVNPAVDFVDNIDDPFGGVSFNANPAFKRRNAKRQGGALRKGPPEAAPSGDQSHRSRPRRLLPQTPDKTPGVTHSGQRVASGQTRTQNIRVIPVVPSASSLQAPVKYEPKSTGNRQTNAAT